MVTKPDPALAQFSSIIDRLKPVVGQPDFNQVLESLTSNIPKPKRFLIKMELNRLSAPCARIIDLRGHVDGAVREFDHQGQNHYLDDVAIGIFQRGLKRYGKYVVGIYEDIMNAENNFRVIHQKQTEQRLATKKQVDAGIKSDSGVKTDYPAKAILFGNRGFRAQERMIYSMTVDVQLTPSQQVRAVTTDLSVSGCKIKLPTNYKISKDQIIKLHYTGLEEEFSLGLNQPVEYKVVGVDEKQGHLYPRCCRTNIEQTKAFDDFLNRFINGNKRRYKLNLDNTVEAVVTKGYEQYYLPRITSLPVYIKEREDGLLYPAYMLTNDNNKGINRQWLDENNQNQLNLLFKHSRLKALLKKPGRIKETLVYGFTHIAKGKVFFYSATNDELDDNDDVRNLFLSFGASKAHWFVYKLQLIDCHHELAHIPLTLPNGADNEAAKLNKPPSARVMAAIENIKYIATLTDLSNESNKMQYGEWPLDMSKVNLLKPFGHAKPAKTHVIEDIPIKFVNLRSETRFIYQTVIEVAGDLFDETGVTKDFSTKGMQIAFDTPVDVEQHDIVQVALPEMQKITKRYKLKNMPYEVVSFNKAKSIINLQVFEERGVVHSGKTFMSELIEKNRTKLKAAIESGAKLAGLAEALRNIYIQRVINTAMYIHKDGIRHELRTLGFSMMPNPLVDQIQNDNEQYDYNLYPFLLNNSMQDVFIAQLRKMQRHNRPLTEDFLIKIRPKERNILDKYEVQLAKQMRNPAAEKIFIQKATQKNTLFFAIRIYISRTGRPDTDFIAKELAYVSQYALHKAKVLEEELWSVAGVIDLVDVTEEYMSRSKFAAKTIQAQLSLRQSQN